MPDSPVTDTVKAEPVAAPVKAEPTPVVKVEDAIPYARFKEVNDELKTLRDEKATREGAETKAKEDKLKKDGEFKTLLDQKDIEIDRLRKFEVEYKATDDIIRNAALAKLTDDKMRVMASRSKTAELLEFVESYSGKIAPPGSPKGAPIDLKASGLQPLPNESPQAYSERMRAAYRKGEK